MKSHFSHIALIAGLTLFGSLSLNAQSKVTATVPFSFQANHASWPAGDYTLRKVGASTSDGSFQLTEESTGRSLFIPIPIPTSKYNYEEGHLTFACSNGDCVLSKIAMPESNITYVRSDSAVEKDLQRKLGMAAMVNVKISK